MKTLHLLIIACLALLTATLPAQVPQLLSYQGRVAVGTTNFDGLGQFKFALADEAGGTREYRVPLPPAEHRRFFRLRC